MSQILSELDAKILSIIQIFNPNFEITYLKDSTYYNQIKDVLTSKHIPKDWNPNLN